MGYALCSLGVLVLWALLTVFRKVRRPNFFFATVRHFLQRKHIRQVYPDPDDWEILFDCAAGYGLGGSTVAMFGRVGGGIYTKAELHQNR